MPNSEVGLQQYSALSEAQRITASQDKQLNCIKMKEISRYLNSLVQRKHKLGLGNWYYQLIAHQSRPDEADSFFP